MLVVVLNRQHDQCFNVYCQSKFIERRYLPEVKWPENCFEADKISSFQDMVVDHTVATAFKHSKIRARTGCSLQCLCRSISIRTYQTGSSVCFQVGILTAGLFNHRSISETLPINDKTNSGHERSLAFFI